MIEKPLSDADMKRNKIINDLGEKIQMETEHDDKGINLSVDYRFYLKNENRHGAPRGVYLAPYASYNSFIRYNKYIDCIESILCSLCIHCNKCIDYIESIVYKKQS